MAFGIYIHIPHCLQVCPYCDFTKYELGKIMPPEEYVALVRQEIRQRAGAIGPREIETLYFGGGTPSLLEPASILALIEELANHGFRLRSEGEFTIEINPGTIDERKLDDYLDLGANRFSVGAQTFNERLLQRAGRKHSVSDTVKTLTLLRDRKLNYSFDLLFALPSQTPAELGVDIAQALAFDPSHLSAYYLTVPEHHPMAKGRASDDDQVEMFRLLETQLEAGGLFRYEISSYAKPGYESRHNHLYWMDQEYWGLGVSAHSYLRRGSWGLRFWNPPALPAYESQVKDETSVSFTFESSLPEGQRELLQRYQALTDFCHVRLRMIRGMNENALRLRFGDTVARDVLTRLSTLANDGLIELSEGFWRLTTKGRLLTNVVFEHLTYLPGDLRAD